MQKEKTLSFEKYSEKNINKHRNCSILETIEKLTHGFKNDVLGNKKQNNILIAIKSINALLSRVDFRWGYEFLNSDLSYFHEGKMLNNVLDFYKENKNYFDDNGLSRQETIIKIISLWQRFTIAAANGLGDFQDSILGITSIIHIKNSDIVNWQNHPEHFAQKTFGDSSTPIYFNFIYKDSDPDFEPSNLKEKLNEFKSLYFLKLMINRNSSINI